MILTLTTVCWKAAHSFLLQGKQQEECVMVWDGKWQRLSGTITHTADKEAADTRFMLLLKQMCSKRTLILKECIEVVKGIKDIFCSSRIFIILFKRIN